MAFRFPQAFAGEKSIEAMDVAKTVPMRSSLAQDSYAVPKALGVLLRLALARSHAQLSHFGALKELTD
eukprot:5151575-Alexandrium_andersonii.AAC.1